MKNVIAFFQNTTSEAKKVVWPKFGPTRTLTLLVLLLAVVVGAYLMLLDSVFGGFMTWFLGA